MSYWVYILRCQDNTLYTGCTDDIERRVTKHNSGKGAKYTRGRRPVMMVYKEECTNLSAALKRELAIKKLTRTEKLKLIASEEESLSPSTLMKKGFPCADMYEDTNYIRYDFD